MSKRKITVATTGLNAIDSPGPGVPVIRSLKESEKYDVKIIGLSYESLEPGIYMKHLVDKTYQIPFPSAGQDALMTRLQYIIEQEGKMDVIIPNFDAELFNFIRLEERLAKEYSIKMLLPTLEQFDSRQKAILYEFGLKHNIKVPRTKVVYSVPELNAAGFQFGYPLVVKGKFYEAGIAYNAEQAAGVFNKISAKWGLPIIVQEFIYGSEVNVTALGDGKGNTIGAVPMRKLFITDKGKAWAGITIDDPKLIQMTQDLLQSTKWRGGLELEVMKTVQEEYYLMEINPRFPAWVYLAKGAGQNHPEALVSLALGENISPFANYEIGKLFIRYSYDMIVDLADFEKISTLDSIKDYEKIPESHFNHLKIMTILINFKNSLIYDLNRLVTVKYFYLINNLISNQLSQRQGIELG
ncbi:MAG: ATP-grasp domain-containing protein [Bacteroidia bacterium]|nr:ATP-grasp domain-containing protein [Bacteroidia bacterium]